MFAGTMQMYSQPRAHSRPHSEKIIRSAIAEAICHTVRKISGPDAKVYDNEFKIALRVGTRPYKYNLTAGQVYYDYHFMRQTDTGQWAEKHGYGGASVLWDAGMTPDTIPWTLCGVPYYDSAIIYYALGN